MATARRHFSGGDGSSSRPSCVTGRSRRGAGVSQTSSRLGLFPGLEFMLGPGQQSSPAGFTSALRAPVNYPGRDWPRRPGIGTHVVLEPDNVLL